jgi:hypothetical protein
MKEGVLYYQNLFAGVTNAFEEIKSSVLNELEMSVFTLQQIGSEIEKLSPVPVES